MKHKILMLCALLGMPVFFVPIVSYAEETTVTTLDGLTQAISSADGTADNPTVINVSGTIEVTTPISASGKNVKLTGGGTLTCSSDLNGSMIAWTDGSLILENITLDGKETHDVYPLVRVGSNTSLVMESGSTLQNNKYSAVEVYGTFTMNGGTIQDNTTSYWGGGVLGRENAKIHINGGKLLAIPQHTMKIRLAWSTAVAVVCISTMVSFI